MNAHRPRPLFSRHNIVPFTFFFLLAIVIVFGLAAGTEQSAATVSGGSTHGTQKSPFPRSEDLAKEFNDDDMKVKGEQPDGNWKYSTLLDSNRFDPSVPAYVSGIQLLSGGLKYSGITKIKRVEVTNRSSRTIISVQVKFEVVPFEERDKILLEDTFPWVNVSIAPGAPQVVEIKALYPAKMLKALARNGELYGNFGLRIGVQEIRFADGSFWRRQESAALLKSPYLNQSPSLRFPTLASLAAHLTPPFRSADTKRADMTQCTLEPRLAASAFSYALFQTVTCHDNAGPSVDSLGRKSCGAEATSTCYAACNNEGFCDTAQGEAPCNGSPPPPPTPTPTPTCEPTYSRPDPCCRPLYYQPDPDLSGRCIWNCNASDYPECEGERLDNGCVVVGGPVVCDEDYSFTSMPGGGFACCPPAPTPTPISETGEYCEVNCASVYGPRWFCDGTVCSERTPVLLDVAGDGFALTDAAGGVDFALRPGGARRRFAWTAAGSDDAWLALDRDDNGQIDGDHELFGNYTPQPLGPERNGFRALAVFDDNADGRIDARDAVFPSLRLWQDVSHDGISQPSELHTLPELDVARIHLDYKESKREDEHGNLFRYRAKLDDAKGAKVNRRAWDVFLVPGR